MKRLLMPLAVLVARRRAGADPAQHAFHRGRGDDRRHAEGAGAAPRHVARDRDAVPRAHRHLRRQAARRADGQSQCAREADELDRERAAGRLRGPLHGIPIALKDNIHTTDMPTTGGALAFDGFVPPYEATLTKNLRDAGAIIIAKTGMTELANCIAGAPTPMPTNYNAVGGFGFNPYDPRRDPRPSSDGRPVLATGGSSSGIGTAANFWAANVGTETSGSILSPSNQNMLVGIKPTVGRVSRYGVIPITADQDTAGPMAKSVMDAAILLGVLEGAQPDPNDPATSSCTPPPGRDYTRTLRPNGLAGRSHRHSSRVVLRRRAGSGFCRAPRQASIPSRRAPWRRDRRAAKAGRGHRRSRRTSPASSTGIPPNNFRRGAPAPAPDRRRGETRVAR